MPQPQVILTEVTHGEPHPLSVHPDHVVSLRPRKTITPVDTSQGDFRGDIGYSGTIVSLVTGTQHFVTEDFDDVYDRLHQGRTPQAVPGPDAPHSTGPGDSEPPAPATKKAPAKKAAAKAPEPESAPEPEPVTTDTTASVPE